jgi:hypothetical protein
VKINLSLCESKRTLQLESTEYCADSRVMYPKTKLCK